MPSTRRNLLASVVAGSAAIAGCITGEQAQSPTPDEPPPSGVDELPDPDGHVFGANGSWSSFGCNANNTRAVSDGEAPVDGVTEQWRVEVPQLAFDPPVVADGVVYLLDPPQTLRALDATDGDELWAVEDARQLPLVRDGVVYVSSYDTVRALGADTGDLLWEREFELPGRVTSPATYAGDQLVCGVGETVVALEADTGEEAWRRDVYGQILDHLAFFMGYGIVVATEAGMVYVLGEDGVGMRRWQLPAPVRLPPTADRDTIYVNCRDGNTYALTGETRIEVSWTAGTGGANHGIGVVDDLVFVRGYDDLYALDTDDGTHRWEYDVGDWSQTAPAYGRETVFVGGDALYALDPTPGGNPDDGPAVRFRQEFAGRVGPGPILDDGVLYVVAEVDEEEYALLALE
ncbi:outer membrane protein assembly factor BamB family protein [Natronobacterium texcoconense]|uniref:Outer membrane protein assembly factor BamB, contains PQQ-like beta-propeller repeat n=1 Tax=Natronobacterium texcoconense TaxID=1095778 RepID=A0A1H1GM20_NATTX|nr:PQQ-binding-like beta-propeller repeat protein [Natronobacterium texcoconense]SDR14187.1 Outer membrane protein assembly factor BamB, contains PQQ-like beta-propeller repeat [Natronobacterium texcoconense]